MFVEKILIKLGMEKELLLGNLDSKRDWGFSGDYVEAMWLMLQQKEPGDYVISTGETHTVREFVEAAFGELGLDWKKYVKINKEFMRPAEVDLLKGDSSKARKELKWKPEINFHQLVKMMVENDLKLLSNSR